MSHKIEWTDETINPYTGCRGNCGYCYARRMARRLSNINGTVYSRVFSSTSGVDPETGFADGDGDPFRPAVHLDVLEKHRIRLTRFLRRGCAGRKTKPRRIFVGSMGDICFEGLALTFVADGGLLPMAAWYDTRKLQHAIAIFAANVAPNTIQILTKRPDLLVPQVKWPRNVQLGVSMTSNEDLWRLEELVNRSEYMACQWAPSLVKWASVEPLLDSDFDEESLAGANWVVVGAQTGPGVKFDEEFLDERLYIRNVGEELTEAAARIVRWCAHNKVPCFVKDNMRRIQRRHRPPMDWPLESPEV